MFDEVLQEEALTEFDEDGDAVVRFEACAAAAGGIRTAVGATTPLATGNGCQDSRSPESVENVSL